MTSEQRLEDKQAEIDLLRVKLKEAVLEKSIAEARISLLEMRLGAREGELKLLRAGAQAEPNGGAGE